jgi:hypothetical protein
VNDEQQGLRAEAAGQTGCAVIGDATMHQRYMKLQPGRYRNRRKCHCGCGGRQSHGGYANGLVMTGGCEWSMRRWVKHGYQLAAAAMALSTRAIQVHGLTMVSVRVVLVSLNWRRF